MRKNRRDANSGVFSAFRVSGWSVRRKVVAVLAIPVVLAAVFGGLRVSTELQDASAYATNQQRANVIGPAIGYLTATERLELPFRLSGKLDAADPTEQFFKAQSALKKAAAGADLSPDQQNDVDQMLQTGNTLANGGGTGITASPSVAISDMNRFATELINSTMNTEGTPDPRVQALTQSLAGRLSLVKQQMLIEGAGDHPSLLDSVWLAAEIGVEGSALDRLKDYVGGRKVGVLSTHNGARLGEATSSNVKHLTAKPAMFRVYDTLNTRLLDGIQSKLAASASSTKSRALTDAAIILLALIASLMLALFVARALIVPLRKVRAGALEVANERLPETVARIRNGQEPEEITPIPVHTHEELGQLARAVDDMHKQAVTLATGEAQLRSQVGAMFVTLSRRNTTLVNQQLALIESLEQDEEDPQRLEQLFSLDHLATRMRRTAESLVILGGAPGRTAGFEELSVSDVIHAAVSEVQDYQRVRIDAAPDRMIVGRAASDIVHLMAELIDNALSYSPPGSPVTIQAGDDDSKVEIEILDNGLGMAGDALAQANDSLKRGGEVTIDTARRMGLFVVSRLAEEHGLKVKLRRNTNGGGIIASISLPNAVLVSDAPVEHVSVLDAPEPAEEPVAPVVDEQPEEDYDPYLERIEEAIAAVTGLPRRRPGQTPGPATQTPAASVGMFDAGPSPELPPGFEPAELPSMEEPVVAAAQTADETGAAQADALSVDALSADPLSVDALSVDSLGADGQGGDGQVDVAEERLAQVVTPDFGAERHEPADAEELAGTEAHTAHDDTEHDHTEQAVEPAEVTEPVAGHEADDVPERSEDSEPEPVPAGPWSSVGQAWGAVAAPANEPVAVEPAAEPVGEPTYDAPEPVVARAEDARTAEQESAEAPVRLQIRRPLSAAPAASALEGDFVAEHDDSEDSTIFGQLRSNWLSDEGNEEAQPWAASEVDRGWSAADRAENADAEDTTRTGLPVRRPGGRLVPGGVSQEPAKVVRDPEAIRNRLAAHAAGVSRGRAAAAAEPDTFDYSHEETGPA